LRAEDREVSRNGSDDPAPEADMADWIFDAPGGLTDFRNPRDWHEAMRGEARDIIAILVGATLGKNPEDVTPAEIAQERAKLAYADPTETPPPSGAETVPIQPWAGFPRAVQRRAPWKEFPPVEGDAEGIYRAVEHLGDEDHRAGTFVDRHDRVLHLPVRDRQDEYLEWAAVRDSDGKIVKLTFVAEGYDYFARLFERDEGRALELYKEFTGISALKVDDLRAKDGIFRRTTDGGALTVVEPGGFNPRNRFNINPGIVHLSHRANSLGAEVNLAGVSGIARKKATGTLLDGKNAEELLCCNQGGNPNRNSDPLISAQAYAQVLGGFHYTLANPVGLYIAGIEEASLLLPDNSQVPREWWRVIRGEGLWDAGTSRVLRMELEVPASEKITVSDLLASGNPVRFPGQVAELISVHLFVTRWKRDDGSVGPIVNCSATCCRKSGGDQLVLSNGSCSSGFELAFPDLLPAPGAAPPAAVAAVADVAAPPAPAIRRLSKSPVQR
jgi:hypothetical protein